MRAAVLGQSLIRDNLLGVDLAVKALQMVSSSEKTLEDALSSFGWRSSITSEPIGLGTC